MKGGNRSGRKWIAFHICGLPNVPARIPKFKVASYCTETEKEEKQRRLETKAEPSHSEGLHERSDCDSDKPGCPLAGSHCVTRTLLGVRSYMQQSDRSRNGNHQQET